MIDRDVVAYQPEVVSPPNPATQTALAIQENVPPIVPWKLVAAKMGLSLIESIEDAHEFLDNQARSLRHRAHNESDPLLRFFLKTGAALTQEVGRNTIRSVLYGTALAYEKVHERVLDQPREELDILLRRSSLSDLQALMKTPAVV